MPAANADTSLARAGATAWRILGVALLVIGAWWLARQLMAVLVPAVVAVMLATLMAPVADRLSRAGIPRTAAALVALGLVIGVVALALLLILPPFLSRLDALNDNVEAGLRQVIYSAGHDLAGISRDQAGRAVDRLLQGLRDNRSQIVGDVLIGATVLAQALAAMVLTLFLAFFVAKDRGAIGRWALSFAPLGRRADLAALGAAIWEALGVYFRGVIFVATVDAVFIGLTLVVVGVPLVMPLIVLTWVAAFFPIVGAIVAGIVSVLVALVAEGTGAALVVAGAIVVVQQTRGQRPLPGGGRATAAAAPAGGAAGGHRRRDGGRDRRCLPGRPGGHRDGRDARPPAGGRPRRRRPAGHLASLTPRRPTMWRRPTRSDER